MSVISLNGLPGKGKTLTGTYLALKHFKKENILIKQLIRKFKREPSIVNNVYSNYPILLNKKKKIYSNKISIYDLKNQWSLLPDSLVIIDEVQLFYDSDDFKIFPRIIANYNQAHRHFLVKDIIYISQHPSRIVKKLRNVMSEYYRIKTVFKIPILKIGFVTARVTYEFEDYDMAFSKDKELRKLKEIKTKVFFMNFRKVYKAYDTIYLYPLNKDKPRLNKGKWQSLVLDNEEKTSLNKALFRSQSDQKGAQDRKELIESKLEEKGSSNDEKKHEQEIPQFNFFTD